MIRVRINIFEVFLFLKYYVDCFEYSDNLKVNLLIDLLERFVIVVIVIYGLGVVGKFILVMVLVYDGDV